MYRQNESYHPVFRIIMIYGNFYSIILLKFKSVSMKRWKNKMVVLASDSHSSPDLLSLFGLFVFFNLIHIRIDNILMKCQFFYQKFHCISIMLPQVQHLLQLDLVIQTLAVRDLGRAEFKQCIPQYFISSPGDILYSS